MKRLLKFMAAILIFSGVSGHNTGYAATGVSETLRIGLEYKYREVDSVPITNTQIHVGYALQPDGTFLHAGTLRAATGFSVVVDNSFYGDTGETYTDYQSAKNRAAAFESAGYKAAPALSAAGGWGVYLGGYATEAEAQFLVSSGTAVKVAGLSYSRIALMDGTATAAVFECNNYYPQIRDAAGGILTLEDRSYRGVVEFGRYGAGKITAVNVIDIEEYLYAVVPSEMPSSWHIEAIKAQSVAARSYTVTRNGIHNALGYGLCDGNHCQVYNGYGNESENARTAVDATRGLAAYYDDEIINATFFSSSGGVTESSENVWPNVMPYLKGVSDSYETTGKVWSRTFSLDEITALLNAANANIGSAVSVTVSAVSSTGRVSALTITGTAGTKVLEKEEVRTFFSSSAGGSLESRYFQIGGAPIISGGSLAVSNGTTQHNADIGSLYVVNSSGAATPVSGNITVLGSNGATPFNAGAGSGAPAVANGSALVFNGRGWGHGVGMSQHGANGMAAAGFTYDQILKHYYTGIEIK